MFFETEKDKALSILRDFGIPTDGSIPWVYQYPVRAVEEIVKMDNATSADLTVNGRQLIWEESILNDLENLYLLKIVVYSTYPFTMPEVIVEYPEINHSMHNYGQGRICLIYGDDYNPKMPILWFRNQAVLWTVMSDLYIESGQWNAPEHAH